MDLVFAPRQIELWPIEKLRPYATNVKIHGEAQVAKIAASMAKFGWTVPCLVADDGELIAGHGRVLAAGALGLTEAPVIRLGHLDEAERRAYRIADNKRTELGEWDEVILRDEIAGLLAEEFDLDLLGFTDEDLEALLQDPETVSDDGAVEGEDDIPEPPVNPVSVPGDLWQLGSHRLICGDSTCADVVGRLLGSVKPLLMVTDPPYGVEYDPSWRNQAGATKTKRTGKVLNDDRTDWREAWSLFPGDVAYIWHGALHAATVAESLIAAGIFDRGSDGEVLHPASYIRQPRGDAVLTFSLAVDAPALPAADRGGDGILKLDAAGRHVADDIVGEMPTHAAVEEIADADQLVLAIGVDGFCDQARGKTPDLRAATIAFSATDHNTKETVTFVAAGQNIGTAHCSALHSAHAPSRRT